MPMLSTALAQCLLVASSAYSASECASGLDCSLNGVCQDGRCVCDAPWNGPHCGLLAFAAVSPAAGRDIYTASDTAHSTWNGPIVRGPDGEFHTYLPLYVFRGPAGGTGNLYNPVSLMHGTAPALYGPWSFHNLSGVTNPQNETGFNPGFLAYNDTATGKTVYTLWITGHPGIVYAADAPGGPFTAVPGSSNTTACDINPSPIFHGGTFYCTGLKGTVIMSAPAISGPWTHFADIGDVHTGEDPHLWVDVRGGWHILYHAANASQRTRCSSSRTAAHIFSADGKDWRALAPGGGADAAGASGMPRAVLDIVEPYKPRVTWADGVQSYSSMERPTPIFDSTGRMSHLHVAAELTIGDAGCAASQHCGRSSGNCPCCECKYQAHAGTVLIELWDGVGPAPTPAPAPAPVPTPVPPAPTPAAPTHPCAAYGPGPAGFTCHSGVCSSPRAGGSCGPTIAEPLLDLSGGCRFSTPTPASLAACATAAAAACERTPGCLSFALDPTWKASVPSAKLFASGVGQLTPNTAWNVWSRASPPPPPAPVPGNGSITCKAGHTLCPAAYAVSGEGCCVHPGAVCCPNKQTCCPAGTKCADGPGVLTQCVSTSAVAPVPPPTPGTSVCKPGAQLPLSTVLRNVLVIGDSVSIGYTPPLAAALNGTALVQHSPYDTRDGGAEDTAYGLQCLDYFLRGPRGERLEPDVLLFNFGLHDGPLGNATVPGQYGNSSAYAGELERIVLGLLDAFPPATSRTRLVFALTSPMLCNVSDDGNVIALNNAARAIMSRHGVPTLDNHAPIVQKCGPLPVSSCFGIRKCFCPHCPTAGYEWLAQTVIAPAIRKMLFI